MRTRIGIDVDGVLRDFCHGLVSAIKTQYSKDVLPERSTMVYGIYANYCTVFPRTWLNINGGDDTTIYIFFFSRSI